MGPAALDSEQFDPEQPRTHSLLSPLQELQPSPISTPDTSINIKPNDGYSYEPSPANSRNTSFLGLNSTSHTLSFYLTRLHQYSTYPLTAFLALHITNTSLLPLITPNLPAASTYLLLTRPFYQSRLLEPLVVTIPLTTHILSGIALRFLRRQQALSRYGTLPTTKRTSSPWPTLSFSSITGYALLPLALSHTFLNRILPLIYEGGSSDISLEYVGHGIARSPVVLTVAYFLLVTVGVAHGVWGWARWLGLLPGQVTVRDGDGLERAWKRKSRAYGLSGTAAVVGLTWLAGGLGVVGRGGKVKGWVGALWDGLYEKVWL